MEPGKPLRPEPGTETPAPTPEDGKGAAPSPRPRSRRGWMSDSPLDGGSGWPTSAYAIVSRPSGQPESTATSASPAAPTNPDASARPVAAPSNPATNPTTNPATNPTTNPATSAGADRTDPAAAAATKRSSRKAKRATVPVPKSPTRPDAEHEEHPRRRAVAVLGALVFVLGVVVAVAFAVRTAGRTANATDAAASTDPSTGTSAGVPTDPSASTNPTPTGNPGATGSAAAPVVPEAGTTGATTGPLRSGTVRLTVVAGRPDEAFDLDSGTKDAPGADLTAGVIGLTATNGAKFAPWTQASTPTAAGCAVVPEAQWSTSVLLAALLPGSNTCVRTSEGRPASFTARAGQTVTDGQLYATYLDFTVWRKSGDETS